MKEKVSIVIAVGVPGDYIRECIRRCLEIDYPDFEIIVLPDEPWEAPAPGIRVIPTGKMRPAENTDALAEALRHLLSSPGEREEMALRARGDVEKRYDLRACVDRIESIYEDVRKKR